MERHTDLVTAPITAIYVGLFEVGNVFDAYPHEREKCSAVPTCAESEKCGITGSSSGNVQDDCICRSRRAAA